VSVAAVAGNEARVPSALVSCLGDVGRGTLFSPSSGEWVQSMLTGANLIAFQIPLPRKSIEPLKASITVDLSAPHHSIELRTGQCVDGVAKENPDGPIVAQWQHPSGSNMATFNLTANDVDSEGRLWLRMDVQPIDSSEALPRWKINDFAVDIVARSQTPTTQAVSVQGSANADQSR
jgi:hypothetical protein